ncbi:MAG: peptidoglycan DD-metalloendopeptidase family protein [Acutalibacter sp.]|nr:peptidoglycan DD-metalloendopeptidase family protein [Acutalibacter sp.]
MQSRRKGILRILAAVLALWILLPGQAMAETVEEVRQRQEELRQENEELEAKLDALRDDEAKALEYQGLLEEKISVTEQKIDVSRESIQIMDREIGILEKKLELSKQEYQETIDLFAKRINALYKSGSVSTLEVLLNSTSFSDFTMKAELLKSVTRHDQKLLEKIEEYLEKTKGDREELQKMRQEETLVKKELESAQDELRYLYAENEAVLAQLEEAEMIARNQLAANQEEDEELEAQIEELIRQQSAALAPGGMMENPPSPGMHDGFSPIWPLPGVGLGNITGHFGDVYDFDSGPHMGLDIGADYGTPIVATQAGQVLSAEYHYSWGNNVLIWHNGTFATRYAHCSALAVSPGEYVEQGQVIGYVGSTGFSRGNHLHYEVYVDGVRTNPDPYLGIC